MFQDETKGVRMLKTTIVVALLTMVLWPCAVVAQSGEPVGASGAPEPAATAPAPSAQCPDESAMSSVLPPGAPLDGVLPQPLPAAGYPVCDAAKYFQVPCSECPEACTMGGQVHPCGCEFNRCWCPL